MPEAPELPASFRPLLPAPEPRRRLVLVVGPLMWLGALLGLAVVVSRRDAVELALLVVAASFAAGVLVSGWMRLARVREERDT